mmetsp:Transcript_24794/g.56868  ORF Transcript_24794/g.56868 Transcript_24794/m.56868 type:complete len:98 (-) Transcript_24794:2311-2604(-)
MLSLVSTLIAMCCQNGIQSSIDAVQSMPALGRVRKNKYPLQNVLPDVSPPPWPMRHHNRSKNSLESSRSLIESSVTSCFSRSRWSLTAFGTRLQRRR